MIRALVVVLALTAGCKKKKTTPATPVPWKGIPATRTCGEWVDRTATCVSEDAVYTCVANEEGTMVECASRDPGKTDTN